MIKRHSKAGDSSRKSTDSINLRVAAAAALAA
jgi:hypothetical protein